MKAPIKKPKRWAWCVVTGMILAGIALLTAGQSRLAGFLISSGVGGMFGLHLRNVEFEKLSPAERREQGILERDERRQMIRERAAWITQEIEGWTLTAFMILMFWVLDRGELMMPFVWFYLGKVLVLWMVHRHLEKKY